MCEFCRSYPCDVSCPYSDVEAVTSCDLCRTGIVSGDTYYIIDGNEICENCIDGYIENYYDEDEPTATTCDICGQVITEDDICYSVEGNDVCENCIEGYVSECSYQA